MAYPEKNIPKIGLLPDYGAFFPPPKAGTYDYFTQADHNFHFEINRQQPSQINAWLLAECSLLAYEEHQFIEQVVSNSQIFGKATTYKLETDPEHADKGTAGFIIEADDFVIVAFRGTELYRLNHIINDIDKLRSTWLDLKTDLKIAPNIQTETTPYFDTAIHSGFYQALKSVWTPLHTQLSSTKNKPLWLTGHSLGAALATLTAYQFPRQLAGLYTFGSPCVGTFEFANAWNEKGLNLKTFRYILGNDATHKIMAGFADYQHIDAEEIIYPERPKNLLESLWNKFIPLDQVDHAPLCYAIQAWNEIPEI